MKFTRNTTATPRPQNAYADPFARRSTPIRDRICQWWIRFTRHGFGYYIREHTSIVRRMADPLRGSLSDVLTPIAIIAGIPLLIICLFPVPRLVWWLGVILYILCIVAGIIFWWAYQDSSARRRDWWITLQGTMGARLAASTFGAMPLLRAANHVMPARAAIREAQRETGCLVHDMGFLLGLCHGVPVYMPYEVGGYHLSPTRMGKGTCLVIPMVVEAPGPVVTTSSRVDTLAATIELRRKGWTNRFGASQLGGPVWVFDPMRLAGGKYDDFQLVWDPIAGCDDPILARKSAEAMVSTVGIDHNNEMWGRMAIDIVQALLLAAALSGGTLADVYRWSQSVANLAEPKRILTQACRSSNADGELASHWVRALDALEREDGRIVGSKMLGVTGAFSALSVPQVRDYLSPAHDDPRLFNMDAFLKPDGEHYGTVYLLSELRAVEGQRAAGAGAFTSMFFNQLRDHARKIALTNPDQKLADPVFLILDEIDNIQPWNGLAQMYTAGQAELIISQSFHQSRPGAQAAFGRQVEEQMVENAQITVMGGLKDNATRQSLARMCGTKRVRSTTVTNRGIGIFSAQSSMSEHTEPVLDESHIREIPSGMCLLISKNQPSAVVELIPYWDRGYEPLANTIDDPNLIIETDGDLVVPPLFTEQYSSFFPKESDE